MWPFEPVLYAAPFWQWYSVSGYWTTHLKTERPNKNWQSICWPGVLETPLHLLIRGTNNSSASKTPVESTVLRKLQKVMLSRLSRRRSSKPRPWGWSYHKSHTPYRLRYPDCFGFAREAKSLDEVEKVHSGIWETEDVSSTYGQRRFSNSSIVARQGLFHRLDFSSIHHLVDFYLG